MADEGGGGGEATEMLMFVFGGFAILVLLWFMSGGPSRANLKGLFLAPPAPIGPGGSYGPVINSSSTKSR